LLRIRNSAQGTLLDVPLPPTDLDRKVAAFLKKQRGAMTYREFGKKVGLNASTVFRLEQCEQSITVGRLHGVLKKLKLSPKDVFG
jgi:transcriptional regulator with XRE-family HTH domain